VPGYLASASLVWHGITKDELLVVVGRSYLDRYIDIEAATNLLIFYIDNIGVSITEPQVVFIKSLSSLSASRYTAWLIIFVSFLSADSYVMGFQRSSLRAVGMLRAGLATT
jgi:hypothetical protein